MRVNVGGKASYLVSLRNSGIPLPEQVNVPTILMYSTERNSSSWVYRVQNLGEMIKSYDKILVPEINNGQLVKILRDQYMVDAIPHNKVMGIPITKSELVAKVKTII